MDPEVQRYTDIAAMQLLRDRLQAIPSVLPEPAVEVEILEFNLVRRRGAAP